MLGDIEFSNSAKSKNIAKRSRLDLWKFEMNKDKGHLANKLLERP